MECFRKVLKHYTGNRSNKNLQAEEGFELRELKPTEASKPTEICLKRESLIYELYSTSTGHVFDVSVTKSSQLLVLSAL